MKRILFFLTVLCLMMSAFVHVDAKVALNKTKVTLKANQTTTLKVTGSTKTISWSSSKKSIAKVSSKGVVTALQEGTCAIRAKVSGKTYQCKVTVKAAINKTTLTLKAGKTYSVKILGTKKKVTWSSNKKSIAKVSAKGVVTGIKAGQCTIRAKVAKKTYQCKVKVSAASSDAESSAGPETVTDTGTLDAEVGKLTSIKYLAEGLSKVKYGSKDEGIALVDQKYGFIAPVSEGTVKVYAKGTKNKKTITRTVQVTVIDPGNVKVGLDVSKYQKTLDVKKCQKNHIDFIILRIGYGTSSGGAKDKKFDTFFKSCATYQMPVGFYWYLKTGDKSRAMNIEDAQKQAKKVVSILNQYTASKYKKIMKMPIYLDLENETLYTGMKNRSKIAAHNQELCEVFIAVLKEAGYDHVSIYANRHWCRNFLNNAYFASFGKDLWHAHYNYIGKGRPTYTIDNQTFTSEFWQFGSYLTVSGTGSARTDVSYLYE